MIDVLLAQKVNRLMGGAVVAPWEIDQLPEGAVDAVLALEQMAAYRQGMSQVEDVFARWRAEHAGKQH